MWEKNPYYNPEALGLTVVAELEFSDMNYCFDTRVVWSLDNALYTARDSGCSCPTPFETYASVEELERVDIRALESEIEQERGYRYGNPNFDTESREFINAVKATFG